MHHAINFTLPAASLATDFQVLKQVLSSWRYHSYYENSFITTRALDFAKIKNNLRTTEPWYDLEKN